MNKSVVISLFFILNFSCKNKGVETIEKTKFQEIAHVDYVLNKPVETIKGVLVLFGGYPEKAEDIKREFSIINKAKVHNIAVLYMNYNRTIWLTIKEKQDLSAQLQKIFTENKLPTNNIYIGGFSSGGNVALLISDFLAEQKSKLNPQGVFIVDSPVDLVALYETAEKNIIRNISEPAVLESTWILETFNKAFGNPDQAISKYEASAIFTSRTNNRRNIKHLAETKIRLYTEPDTLWWKTNKGAEYDEMNAFYIKKLSESLKDSGFKSVEYISTENKGYRSNGERHPHSWAIVDKAGLVNWMLDK